jgi:hypothetical protein
MSDFDDSLSSEPVINVLENYDFCCYDNKFMLIPLILFIIL